ncbi:hypothetical protein PZN02_006095 (plasmid) [Sinorhizobium garamanticum]|uniref:Trypsin-like peptidase domain-containing protein n=1 Tax=Sinorhizobium garamanticum TaxID=680247 RepID=A0ABY8DLK8_9HYPH|nr:hypothetical protein [Sinorhizobium garamanticum]WEX91775.1 hypothetical protein PZN02_006095 [Sinorhizobium garamanticum]
MRAEIDFSNTPEFADFMAGLPGLESAQELIHGIYIYPHPFWVRLAGHAARAGVPDPQLIFGWWWWNSDDWEGLFDMSQKFSLWEHYCMDVGKKKDPFLVCIYIVPTTNRTIGLRRQIQNYAAQQPFFATVEEEEVGWLATSIGGGLEVNAPNTGTLGGFLKDQHGDIYGVTCGHVATAAGASFALPDVAGVSISNAGSVLHSNFPAFQLNPKGAVCNQYTTPAHPEVDLALLTLDPAHVGTSQIAKHGTVVDIYDRTVLGSGSQVSMRGAVSGKKDYIIGGYGVTSRLKDRGTGNSYCFSHLFDFAAPRSLKGGRVSQAIAARPLSGDSGAFVCDTLSSGDLALFGMLIATRGAAGVACFADSITNWASHNHGLMLTHL